MQVADDVSFVEALACLALNQGFCGVIGKPDIFLRTHSS
jgi:hypothetical protein